MQLHVGVSRGVGCGEVYVAAMWRPCTCGGQGLLQGGMRPTPGHGWPQGGRVWGGGVGGRHRQGTVTPPPSKQCMLGGLWAVLQLAACCSLWFRLWRRLWSEGGGGGQVRWVRRGMQGAAAWWASAPSTTHTQVVHVGAGGPAGLRWGWSGGGDPWGGWGGCSPGGCSPWTCHDAAWAPPTLCTRAGAAG